MTQNSFPFIKIRKSLNFTLSLKLLRERQKYVKEPTKFSINPLKHLNCLFSPCHIEIYNVDVKMFIFAKG